MSRVPDCRRRAWRSGVRGAGCIAGSRAGSRGIRYGRRNDDMDAYPDTRVNTNGKLIIYDLFRHIRSAWARPRVTNARPRGRARTRKPQLKRWPVGLGPPAAARTSLVRSTKNETLTKPGLHLCLSVKLCLSVPLRSACECSVAEERTAEARVRRARTAPSMGRKELPTHAKQPSSIALCSRLRS